MRRNLIRCFGMDPGKRGNKMEQKVYVIGIGPGAYEEMTIRAFCSLAMSDVVGS